VNEKDFNSFMRLVSFIGPNSPNALQVGVLVPLGGAVGTHTHVVNLTAAFAVDGGELLHRGMRQLLEEADTGGSLDRAAAAVATGRWRVPLDAVSLRAPIYDPEKV
jgi:hypothetical protein